MKKIILTVFLSLTLVLLTAQNRPLTEVDFIGVDFTMVNVIGATESDEQFIKVFEGINNLMIAEPEKYDVGKFLNLNVKTTFVEDAIDQVDALNTIDFTNRRDHEIDIDKVIANYPNSKGKKLILIVEELNKGKAQAKFVAVIFDGEDKEILKEFYITGEPGGFGLRNFWAGAIYNGLKEWQKSESN